MAKLSPEAQATLDAFNDVCERVGAFKDGGDALAAGLREAADQVFQKYRYGKFFYHKIYQIAKELES